MTFRSLRHIQRRTLKIGAAVRPKRRLFTCSALYRNIYFYDISHVSSVEPVGSQRVALRRSKLPLPDCERFIVMLSI